MADANHTYITANFACLPGYGNDVGVVDKCTASIASCMRIVKEVHHMDCVLSMEIKFHT